MSLLGAGSAAQRLDYLRSRLGKRLHARELVIFYLHDVIAELGLHHGTLTRLHAKSSIGKWLHHLALAEVTQVAAGVFGARVVRELFGQLGEIATTLDLLQEVIGFGLSRALLCSCRIGRDRDQDVARTNLFRVGE